MKSFLISVICIFVCNLFFPANLSAIGLQKETEISIPPKARVYGSMEGATLVYNRPNITVYNNRLKSLWSKKVKNNIKPAMSPNGEFIVLATYNDHSPTTLKIVKFDLYDSRGKYQWSLPKPEATLFELADNGYIFGIEGVPGISPTRIHLYDKFSDRLSVVIAETYRGLKFSPDGLKFIVDMGAEGLAVYDSLGGEKAILPAAQKYIIDQDNQYIVLFSNGVVRIFRDEKEVKRFRTGEETIVDMAVNVETGVLILMSEKRVEVFDVVTGRQTLDQRVQNLKESFTSLDLTRSGDMAVCASDVNLGTSVTKAKRHVEGYVYLLPLSGAQMHRLKINYASWGVGLPKVYFSKTGASVFVQTKESLVKYRIK